MKPNHFFHDNLGCPLNCTKDHNHPASPGGLSESDTGCTECAEQ